MSERESNEASPPTALTEPSGSRRGEIKRVTTETDVRVAVELDGTGEATIDTGIGFLDHLLTALTRHARMNVTLSCRGDLHIDDHHTAEDVALALGSAIDRALGDRRGIRRFGHAYAPLDESLARAVVDLSGRPFGAVDLGLVREKLGTLSTEMIPHVARSLAMSARATIHLEVLRGENDHHRAEAAFKALALALRTAIARDDHDQVPSTKETLG